MKHALCHVILKLEEEEKGTKAATSFITEPGRGSENNTLRLSQKQSERMITEFMKNSQTDFLSGAVGEQ